MANLNLLDLAKLNGTGVEAGLIEAVGAAAPEVTALPARTIRGTEYRRVLRTGDPAAAFRAANEGVTGVKSTFESKLVECFILSARVEVDKAIAKAYEDGPEALMEIEARGVMRSALRAIGSQAIYGISASVKGFAGLAATVASTMKVDASASGTASTGSSVYVIAAGEDGVQFVYGSNQALQLSDWREGDATDASSNRFAAYIADLTAWVGLQVVNPYAIAQIYDLTADSGKTLTDSLLSQAIEKFPLDTAPTHILMNRRSRAQLQRSRTVTIFSGAGSKAAPVLESIAPIPTEAFGLPIICTDSITSTEAIVS